MLILPCEVSEGGGDSKGDNKVVRVNWKDVFRVKSTCGLGVKGLRLINHSL